MLNVVRPAVGVTRSSARQHRARNIRVVATLPLNQPGPFDNDCSTVPSAFSRRKALLGALASSVALGSWTSSPGLALAKAKEPTIVNDPALLKSQLEAQYSQWAEGRFDAWLAGQPETIKWQSSYNGVLMKFKGKAGAQQYFAMLQADLDFKSYKPLAIFVDNDGDEATVVVEAAGISKRTQQPFSTIFLHMYTIGPGGQVIKFKEITDTAALAQLAPPSASLAAPPTPAPSGAVDVEAPVAPGAAARSI